MNDNIECYGPAVATLIDQTTRLTSEEINRIANAWDAIPADDWEAAQDALWTALWDVWDVDWCRTGCFV